MTIVRLSTAVVFSAFIMSAPCPAFAVEGNWWFWTTTNDANPLPYSECIRRAPAAIASQGLTASLRGNGNVFTVPTGPVWLSLMCLAQARGFYMILNVSTDGSRSSQAVGDAVAGAFWGTAIANSCSSPVGTWNWWNGGTVTFNSDGTVVHSNGHRGNWQPQTGGSWQVHVHWDYPSDDYFRLSPDGKTMTGNFNGSSGTSTRDSC